MSIINIKNLTKDYGHHRGIFDISLEVNKGECYGFLGPNGAGKTTTIRHLMGFSKPQSGTSEILGKDCWKNAAELKDNLGYLPGEISFPEAMTGREFLNYMKNLRRIKSMDYCNDLINRFHLDTAMKIHDMSLGDRRKLAVVTAFMHNPDILILDEPTSGLDPVMQQVFIDFILSEKKCGKTILLSSHIFHEVDATCDRISIIKNGEIVADFSSGELKARKQWIYRITFENNKDYETFIKSKYLFTNKDAEKQSVRIVVGEKELNSIIVQLSDLEVKDIREIPYTLEDHFMQFYKEDNSLGGVLNGQ